MKHRISISVDEETIQKIQERLRGGYFRNKSHLVEYAINRILEDGGGPRGR